ncbi:hypothetical protein [Alistipes finegoldii]|uniref:hypothetical protein n=1 Tax=Alistipes finegoldii TaxID=214856 RepID=UPI0024302ED7|nr:hypothetical protein [Alistipes finegoldii]
MTLTEYIDQTNPQPGVKVVLKEGEYIRRNTVKATPFSFHTAINIPAIAQRYGIEGSYIWLGNNPQLFTRNPQTGELRASVFFLPANTPEPPEIIRFRRFLKANSEFIEQWEIDNPYKPGEVQKRNARFREAYAEYLDSVRDIYALSDEDIDFWLI